MPGNDLVFYGTTGTGGGFDGDAQSDPSLYLGRFRSSTRLDEFQSTLTSNQGARDRHTVIDTTRIGDGDDAHELKWLLFQTGPAAIFASRIMSFDSATGEFKLEERTPSAAVIGDDYAVFARNNVWPDVSIAEARDGDEKFRCISFRNQHGVDIDDVSIYFEALNLDGSEFARIQQDQSPPLQPFIERSDGVTDILDSFGQRDPAGGPDNFVGSGGWQSPATLAMSDTSTLLIGNNFSIAIWMRRLLPALLLERRRSVAIKIVVETSTTGSDPDPLVGACILAFDVLGEDPTVDLEVDRFVHIDGGARLKATVEDSGGPVPDADVNFDVRSGDEGTIATDGDPDVGFDETNEEGCAFATFLSPSDPIFEGDLTHPQAIVGAGDEVGDP